MSPQCPICGESVELLQASFWGSGCPKCGFPYSSVNASSTELTERRVQRERERA